MEEGIVIFFSSPLSVSFKSLITLASLFSLFFYKKASIEIST